MKRVLVCDDDEDILELTRLILEGKGYLVDTVSDSSGITERLRSAKPDIVLLDLYFPGGGEAFIRTIRSDMKLRHIPIILMSASSDTEKTARHIKADGYINKPFDIEKLTGLVENMLRPDNLR